jgi:carboxypeptidase family protein
MVIPVCLAAMLAGPRAPAGAAQPPAATASIRGRVVAADSGQPLRRALVQINQIDGAGGVAPATRDNRSISADGDGVYEFKNLSAGRYYLSASKNAYVRLMWGQEQPAAQGKPIDVAAGERIDRMDFALPRGGVITGRIYDEFGEPLPGLRVTAVPRAAANGARQSMPGFFPTATDDLGEFRIYGLPAGQYLVQALWLRLGPGDPASPNRTGYPPTFFPGTTVEAEAQRFNVAADRIISGVVMTMTPIRTARVEGMVVDAQGHPAGNVAIAMLASVGGHNSMTTVTARPDGTFVLASVAPGDYAFRTEPSAGREDVAMTRLTLAGGDDVKDLRLVMMPAATISGRVVIDPSMRPPSAGFSLMAALENQFMPGGMRPVRVADDLTFEMTAQPGRNQIATLNLPPGWMLRSMRVDGVEVIDQGIDVTPGQRISGVDIELTTKIATVSGLVTNARGEPARDCTVVLFSTDTKRWKPGSRYVRTARPDQEGRFKLSSLPPSDYYIVAVDNLEPGQWADAEFLERVAAGARRLSIAEGETPTVNLELTTGR